MLSCKCFDCYIDSGLCLKLELKKTEISSSAIFTHKTTSFRYLIYRTILPIRIAVFKEVQGDGLIIIRKSCFRIPFMFSIYIVFDHIRYMYKCMFLIINIV
jgi:hypothetical protein